MDMLGARDVRMVERAVRERWPLTDEQRKGVVVCLLKIVVDPDSSTRAKTAAARTIVAMEGQNQADEHKARPDQHLTLDLTAEQIAGMTDDELDQLITRLGSAAGRA